jgi:genome maintenance exonuclease 1
MIVIGNFHHATLNLELPELERLEIAGERFYKSPDGRVYPSVTTVTGFEKRAFFAEWRKKNPSESKRVCSRGTSLHSVVEKYLLNEKIDLSELGEVERDLFYTIKPEVDKITKIHCLESPLYSKTLQLAGRVDCIAFHDGKLAVIDFKGSTRNKKREEIENYFLQASSYALMFQEMTGIKVPDIKILLASEEGICQVFEDRVINNVPRLKEVIDTYFDYINMQRSKNEKIKT